ncbi:MAG TPA: hypothetical protein VG122_09150 [Gemmata sp.]|jgi:hypothetical protein|nr:hypothetical protein [Gemmata sp.]
MNQDRAKQLVAEAKKNARKADSWIGLSNSLSDPQSGLIAHYFPDIEQRQEFLRSPEYEVLNQLLLRLMKRKGLYPGVTHGKNGTPG